MSSDLIPMDLKRRVDELEKLGFNVSVESTDSESGKGYLLFKITKEKTRTRAQSSAVHDDI